MSKRTWLCGVCRVSVGAGRDATAVSAGADGATQAAAGGGYEDMRDADAVSGLTKISVMAAVVSMVGDEEDEIGVRAVFVGSSAGGCRAVSPTIVAEEGDGDAVEVTMSADEVVGV